MSNTVMSMPARNGAITVLVRARDLLESVPYALLALPLRAAVATVFWNSGTTKLASWDTTLSLFTDEY
jgi:putative oxidoreductase